ncbi:MAG: hypothetical protein ABR540_16000 [Acidimicrobiales bacterium]
MALGIAGLFVGARLIAQHGDPSRFVVAGQAFVDRTRASDDLHVRPGDGYDGQFQYRLALDPLDLGTDAHGIRLDAPFRRQRIGYSAVAWLVSGGGQRSLVPEALIAVNVMGIGVIALLGGLVAREGGRSPLWGLLPAGYWGFVMTVARDLTEVTAGAAVLAGLVLYRRRRFVWAGTVLALGALTRESTMIVVAAIGLVWLVSRLKRLRAPGGPPAAPPAAADDAATLPSADDATTSPSAGPGEPWAAALAWALPTLAFLAWQLRALAAGPLPLTSSGGNNLAIPFSAMAPYALSWVEGVTRPRLAIRLAELLALAGFAVMALRSLRRSQARSHEKLAWLLTLVLAVCLSDAVYVDPADFRHLGESFVLGSVVLLGDPTAALGKVAAATGVLWTVVAGFRVFVL